MDPFELLKKDHEKVADLFKRIEAASGKAKLGVFKQINNELELHTHIEETIFYPAIEKARETRDLTLEAYEEHKVVKELLGELAAARDVTDEWKAKLTVLQENVEHHVDEEENELFDKANDVLTGEEAETLGDRMQAEKVARGGSAAAPREEPGLLRKIANALGVGTSPPEPSKANSTKKASKKTSAKKSSSAATKAKGKKASKSESAATARKSSPSRKGKAAAGTKSRVSRGKAAGKSKAAKHSAPKKKTAAKK